MLTSAKLLNDYRIAATDGDIGKVRDCLFDDRTWVVRYVTVETGSWLESRQVLVSPYGIGDINETHQTLPVHITKERVRNSPDIDTHKTVSRQHEMDYAQYYGYPYYWMGAGLWGESAYLPLRPPVLEPLPSHSAAANGDPGLRSCEEVEGYRIQALDGEIGSISDFLIEKDSWAIRYLVVNAGHWWSGNKVLIPPQWATGVHWTEETVSFNLSRDVIQAAPPFTSCDELNRQLELDFYRHYNKPTYWDRGI